MSETTHQLVSPDHSVTVKWLIAGEMIEFDVSAQTSGWVAVGLNDSPFMRGADMAVFWIDPITEKSVLLDTHARGNELPREDVNYGGTADLVLLRSEHVAGHTKFAFRRKLNTGDPFDFLIQPTRETYVLWAYSTQPGRVSHEFEKHDSRGVSKVNLFDGSQSSSTTLHAIHGSLMLVVWLIILPASFFLARYLKNYMGHVWFRVHVTLFILAIGLQFGALAVIFISAGFEIFFISWHSVFGTVLFLLVVIQGAVGYASHRLWLRSLQHSANQDADDEVTPASEVSLVPAKYHHYLGRGILLLGTLIVV